MTGWQPIDSAPRDGRVVLLAGGSFFCEAREERMRTPFTAAWDEDDWLIVGKESGYVCAVYTDPTHWMPLPPPPQEPTPC